MAPTLSTPFAQDKSNSCSLCATRGDCTGSPAVVSVARETSQGGADREGLWYPTGGGSIILYPKAYDPVC
jgi:hypothetical protein